MPNSFIFYHFWNLLHSFRSPDGDTNYFDIAAGVLHGDTLAPYLLIIYLDYVLRTSIDIMNEYDSNWQRKETENTPHKQLRFGTTLMT